MMKTVLILIFKMYKMAEKCLQLLQTGTDPLISAEFVEFSVECSSATVDLFHLWSASQLPYTQNEECS